MKNIISLFILAISFPLFAQQGEQTPANLSSVGAKRPPAYLMNTYEIKNISDDQRKRYCDLLSKHLMLLKTSEVLPANEKISSSTLQQMGLEKTEWQKQIKKVYAACADSQNKNACDILMKDREDVIYRAARPDPEKKTPELKTDHATK